MRVSRLLVLLAAGLLVTGCSAGVQPPPAPPPVPVAPPVSVAPPNGVDFVFAEQMVVHHAQAVSMSRTLLTRPGVPERVQDIARFIVQDQQGEADRMTAWLQAWNRPPAAAADHAGHGMLTDSQLAGFATAPDPARVYLTLMIEHHDGAIFMARSALETGDNAFIRGLAKHIVNEQTAENDSMRELLTRP